MQEFHRKWDNGSGTHIKKFFGQRKYVGDRFFVLKEKHKDFHSLLQENGLLRFTRTDQSCLAHIPPVSCRMQRHKNAVERKSRPAHTALALTRAWYPSQKFSMCA